MPAEPATRPARERAAPAAAGDDGLGLYRLLASFPRLASFRAKVRAVVVAGFAVPVFVLLFALVLGAGRVSLVAVLGIVVLVFGVAAGATVRMLDRLVRPIDLAAQRIDDVALKRPLERIDVPGGDAVAQIVRGVQALAARVEAQVADLRRIGEIDPLTGLWNRRAGRERTQQLIERECRRGRSVRVVLADIAAFASFNATHGAGRGDALLATIGQRLSRIAGDDGVAARWDGDAFLLAQAGAADAFADASESLGRPIVVKGSDEPVMLDLGVATTAERIAVDALIARAEVALRAARGRAPRA
jgi:diguanylate cyclase (GGDEF)-like protein